MSAGRLGYAVDKSKGAVLVTAHAGVPLLVELLRVSGTAAVIDRTGLQKKRDRGLHPSQFAESLLALWLTGGERVEDLDHLQEDYGLQELLGYSLPATQTMRDFLDTYHDTALGTLWEGSKSSVLQENSYLQGLAIAHRHFLSYAQKRSALQRLRMMVVVATSLLWRCGRNRT